MCFFFILAPLPLDLACVGAEPTPFTTDNHERVLYVLGCILRQQQQQEYESSLGKKCEKSPKMAF